MTNLEILKEKFTATNDKNKLPLIEKIVNQGDDGYQFLREFLNSCEGDATPIMGKAFLTLSKSEATINCDFIQEKYPHGLVNFNSDNELDYQDLQQLLLQQKFQEADALTRVKLCQLAGKNAIERKWVYFTEVEKFSITDLNTIDQLWQVYSEGKFGYRIQRKMWLALGKDYTQLWTKLKWKAGNKWTKYPHEFIWSLDAPVGHLPLSNQLRGVRVIDAMFAHPAWKQ